MSHQQEPVARDGGGGGAGRGKAKEITFCLRALGLLPTYLGHICTAQRTIKPSSALSGCSVPNSAGHAVHVLSRSADSKGTQASGIALALQMVEQELQLWGLG